jgi:hypothetical protein
MKRLKLLVVLAASGSALALLVYPAALSAANGKPSRIAIADDEQSVDFPTGWACSFEPSVAPVSNNQYIKTYPADASGDSGSSSTAPSTRRAWPCSRRRVGVPSPRAPAGPGVGFVHGDQLPGWVSLDGRVGVRYGSKV